jgi:hypothetical protein
MPVVKGATASVVVAPDSDPEWHSIARRWFDSLKVSAQNQWYEPSDWATAYLVAESISRDLNPQVVGITERGDVVTETIPLKGASLSAYLRAMGNLLTTEGDRRRASVELQRNTATDAGEDHAGATVTDLVSRIGG